MKNTKQLKDYLNNPKVILANKLNSSADILLSIELIVFLKLNLTFEEVLKFNPNFDAHISKPTFEEFANTYNSLKTEDKNKLFASLNKLNKKLHKNNLLVNADGLRIIELE